MSTTQKTVVKPKKQTVQKAQQQVRRATSNSHHQQLIRQIRYDKAQIQSLNKRMYESNQKNHSKINELKNQQYKNQQYMNYKIQGFENKIRNQNSKYNNLQQKQIQLHEKQIKDRARFETEITKANEIIRNTRNEITSVNKNLIIEENERKKAQKILDNKILQQQQQLDKIDNNIKVMNKELNSRIQEERTERIAMIQAEREHRKAELSNMRNEFNAEFNKMQQQINGLVDHIKRKEDLVKSFTLDYMFYNKSLFKNIMNTKHKLYLGESDPFDKYKEIYDNRLIAQIEQNMYDIALNPAIDLSEKLEEMLLEISDKENEYNFEKDNAFKLSSDIISILSIYKKTNFSVDNIENNGDINYFSKGKLSILIEKVEKSIEILQKEDLPLKDIREQIELLNSYTLEAEEIKELANNNYVNSIIRIQQHDEIAKILAEEGYYIENELDGLENGIFEKSYAVYSDNGNNKIVVSIAPDFNDSNQSNIEFKDFVHEPNLGLIHTRWDIINKKLSDNNLITESICVNEEDTTPLTTDDLPEKVRLKL
jgi:hypothetical protein